MPSTWNVISCLNLGHVNSVIQSEMYFFLFLSVLGMASRMWTMLTMKYTTKLNACSPGMCFLQQVSMPSLAAPGELGTNITGICFPCLLKGHGRLKWLHDMPFHKLHGNKSQQLHSHLLLGQPVCSVSGGTLS